ncbi:hypothetical protein XENOCAPTIV_028428 [Xenoophorus captivus]|uniref:Uncharacterized protein n=1 Tax=Xenoophorus captivus TaxID=1517983 RepID=A0ABV0S1C5_9TELE
MSFSVLLSFYFHSWTEVNVTTDFDPMLSELYSLPSSPSIMFSHIEIMLGFGYLLAFSTGDIQLNSVWLQLENMVELSEGKCEFVSSNRSFLYQPTKESFYVCLL